LQNVFTKWTGEELGNFGDGICGGNRWQRPPHKISQAPRCAVSFFERFSNAEASFGMFFQQFASDSAPGCLLGLALLVFLV
jgi:hypothetical protein